MRYSANNKQRNSEKKNHTQRNSERKPAGKGRIKIHRNNEQQYNNT